MISRQQSRQQSNLLCARSLRWMRHRAGFPRHNRTLRLENFKQTKNWITALVIWNTLKNIHGENTFLTGVSLGTSLVANWQDFWGIRSHTSSGICGQLDMVGLATTQRVKPVSVTQRHRRGTVEAPLGICTRHRRVSEGVGHTWVVQTLELCDSTHLLNCYPYLVSPIGFPFPWSPSWYLCNCHCHHNHVQCKISK